MEIHVSRNGAQLGPFSESEVREKLIRGELSGSDLGWFEGLPEWQTLFSLFPPPAAPPSMSPFPPAPAFRGQATGAAQKTSGAAIGSLICGILGFVTGVTALIAVILGHISLSQIKQSAGRLGGHGSAIAGLVMGYLVLGLVAVAILAALAVPVFNKMEQNTNQLSSMNNCRQIIMAMKIYANDNNGSYPDSIEDKATGELPKTANDALRKLFQNDVIQDERIFGCKASRFIPDGDIGSAPAFEKALEPGENHWAITHGATTESAGSLPLVFEAPAEPTWPPLWNVDMPGVPIRGRVWRDRAIIIGRNDNSVNAAMLGGTIGHVTVRGNPNGGNDFTKNRTDLKGNKYSVLDIAE